MDTPPDRRVLGLVKAQGDSDLASSGTALGWRWKQIREQPTCGDSSLQSKQTSHNAESSSCTQRFSLKFTSGIKSGFSRLVVDQIFDSAAGNAIPRTERNPK